MSPVQAMERSYSTLKQMLREGTFAPGFRLEANRLADELGVSMTPVRDVLHRLVGERLVEASSGEGFHVPDLSEDALRDLYEWNSALLLIAVRTARLGLAVSEPELPRTLTMAEHTALLFERMAAGVPNAEVGIAIAGVSDRLHPFRMIEGEVLEPILGELDVLDAPISAQVQAIRRYHLRRMRAVPGLLRQRRQRRPGQL